MSLWQTAQSSAVYGAGKGQDEKKMTEVDQFRPLPA